jgi:glycosyltransferase involved in cell wall biosynthesis
VVSNLRTSNEGSAWRYRAYRLTNRLADATVAVSQDVADALAAHNAAPRPGVLVVPSGIDVQAFSPDADVRAQTRAALGVVDSTVWLAVGRLTAAKAFPDLLNAFGRVARERPETRLLIAGPGPDHDALAARVATLGLEDRVQLLGSRDDVRDLMQAADAQVLSSAWEGLPMALLEAAASALPIVATRVGGNSTIVVDGESGILVPPSSPEALAAAMVRVSAMSPEERREMGALGRAHVASDFDLEARVDDWEALYRQLVARRGVRG